MVKTIKRLKWVKYSIPFSLFIKLRKKADSEGYSLCDVSRLLAQKYVNGEFDLEV